MSRQTVTVVAALLGALALVAVTVLITLALDGDDSSRSGAMGHGMAQSYPASEAEYLTEMVAHHEDAVDAATQLARSERKQMRELGASIVDSQTAQIEQMNDWLARWHPDADPTHYEPMMRDLSGLDGDQLDRAFLDDMIGHHMTAVMMSQHLLAADLAEHAEVTELAEQIREEQHAEIATMMRWFRDWYGASWRGGPMGMMGDWSGDGN